jgi:hypothetical protein
LRFSTQKGARGGAGREHGAAAAAALFTTIFHEAAAHPTLGTLASLPGRTAVSPSYKFPACMRAALPERLRGMLDWTLPPAMDEASAEARGVSTSSDSHVRKEAKL